MRVGPRELMVLAVVLAVPVASYALVFKPQNERIAKATSEIAHKRELLQKLQQETAMNEDLLRANEEIAERIQEIENRLPTNREVDAVVRQVSDLAVEAGLVAPALKTGRHLRAATYMEQPLEIETEGNFHGFYDFLLRLEQLPRITRIPDLKLRATRGMEAEVEVGFTLSIYFQEDGGGAP
ncbi:MAG: hypothetical protein EA378_10220 [Phycisphaerales bacterium]|nr:MAG: hypothetical protein EA378_10220 [Phycisphaerales bacterium]